MSQQTKVAVLGLGAMGHAFASNLLKKGFRVSGWNRSAGKGEDLVPAGLQLADSVSEAVSEAAVIITMLSDGDTTLNIAAQAAEALSAQAIFCQMGTIGVDATRLLQQFLQQKRPDVVFLDAPVSGTKAPAENAMITVFASGERSRATAAESVFAAISKGSLWLGEAGAGSRMKLVVNSWLIGLMQSLAESELLAESLGFSPEDLWQALEGGPLAAPYAKGKLQMISRDDFTPQMQLVWALKDARLATEAGDVQQLPALKNITELWQQAVDDGFGEQDLAVISKFLANRSKQ
ncbi:MULTISPECIES: NAD(P)-dependent oxidoreductase [Tatumella]|uniref:NAD(P)-dependent oxidoreductase n=1 Tax=Tatumella punctata TaxID=399969 RepID=A0ABW1VIK9_9GAMM|nr:MULTISPECIES: NAD(P)-dependent oxidoreductase [unclassified Tatumella]MBS0855080.1 NAD(P)-dependent oxidoreductase [Tatumella sp. JGM16]MBS0876110.1 NAD(P)-dependent oxidoreductase [Tatumella sp. JGM82]MBS0889158.1 NAD(P)-dependent oxidoreductase [Tatumella sp. JGM94]MBS0892697.1 NAD(P)-dependent oxidoreductase [Tatumella sp. JGM130]MBS0901040.1 NAD(P)-dependent oxidoreductase [Tatumella sp. JGM100]